MECQARTGRGVGWRCGGGRQAGRGSGFELSFFLQVYPVKPAGLDSDAFRVNSEPVFPGWLWLWAMPRRGLYGFCSRRREGKLFLAHGKVHRKAIYQALLRKCRLEVGVGSLLSR